MKVETTRFGPLEIPDDEVLSFPESVIGFENCTRFVLVDRRADRPVWWLQSLDRPEVAFVVTDPASVVPSYRPRVPAVALEPLGLRSLDEAELSVMLVVSGEPKQVTANLLGPLVINPHTRLGKQVILRDTRYSSTHRLLETAGAGVREGGEPRC